MKRSLKTKLQLSFTGIFLVLTMLVCLVWYKMMGDTAKEQAVHYVQSTVDFFNEEFDSLMKDANYISLILSFNAMDQSQILTEKNSIETYRQLESDRILTRSVNDFYSYRSYISSIMLCGINGRVFSNGVVMSPGDFVNMPWYEELEQSGNDGIFIKPHSNYPSDNRQKTYVISVGRKLWNNQKHIGYLLVDLSYDYIDSRFSSSIMEGSSLFIMDEQGGLIYDSRADKVPVESIYQTDFKEIAGELGAGGGQSSVWIGGEEYLAIHKRSEFTGWTTVSLMPMNLILRDVNKTLSLVGWLSAFCLVVGVFLIGGFSTIHTRHILKLKRAVDHLDVSSLETLPEIRSGDEVDDLLVSFNQMIERMNQLMQDLEERKQRERQAEFKALYAQISPHFLSNTLNTISWLADRQNAGNISEITTSLITLLHYSMKNKNEVVALREELEYVKNYLIIQEYRYYGMFEVSYAVDSDAADCRILKFIIQPLVENSILHGFSRLERQGKILIKAVRKDDCLVITVTDNGVGFSGTADRQHKTHHIGLDNVRERITLFYGSEYFLKIESKEHYYTKVTMELPYLRGEADDSFDDRR